MQPDYVSHGDLLLALGRLEGKMDSVQNIVAGIKADQTKYEDKANKRIASLELWRAGVLGAGAIVSAGLAAAWSLIKSS